MPSVGPMTAMAFVAALDAPLGLLSTMAVHHLSHRNERSIANSVFGYLAAQASCEGSSEN